MQYVTVSSVRSVRVEFTSLNVGLSFFNCVIVVRGILNNSFLFAVFKFVSIPKKQNFRNFNQICVI